MKQKRTKLIPNLRVAEKTGDRATGAGRSTRSSFVELLDFEKQWEIQQKGVDTTSRCRGNMGRGKKRGFGFGGQKHSGDKENENKPGYRQVVVSSIGWESRDAQGATEAAREVSSWQI